LHFYVITINVLQLTDFQKGS